MTTPRPVRYRCQIPTQLELDDGAKATTRVLELSESGAFVEEVQAIQHVQPGDAGVLGIALPGGDPWVAHVRFSRWGSGHLDVTSPRAEHVSISVKGFGVEFDQLAEDDLERLRDYLELLEDQ